MRRLRSNPQQARIVEANQETNEILNRFEKKLIAIEQGQVPADIAREFLSDMLTQLRPAPGRFRSFTSDETRKVLITTASDTPERQAIWLKSDQLWERFLTLCQVHQLEPADWIQRQISQNQELIRHRVRGAV